MTIREIAQESGYGVGTVSRVLNNSKNVSENTRKEIMAIVKKNGYHPNANARNLKQKSRFGIAMIVRGSQNMLLTSIVEKMQAGIEAEGFPSMIYYIDEDDSEVTQAEIICRERRPYGIVFFGSNLDESITRLDDLNIPCLIVTISAASLNLKNVSSIAVDDTAAARSMIEYLYARGHRKIGIIGAEDSLPSKLRLLGCQSAFFSHGLAFDEKKQCAYTRYSLEGGYDATERLLKSYPEMTAIFAMSDVMAVGAVRALYDHGLRVPYDISVAGYDGISLARFVNPSLTTVRQNVERMAERGKEILLHAIRENSGAVHEIVPFEIQEGNSVRTLEVSDKK